MAPTYAVAADVVDIATDRALPTDAFLVDTNVWYWQTYTRASQSVVAPPNPRQVRIYPNYLSGALRQKSQLLRCGLSLSELSHLIEKVEHELCGRPLTFKEFRHIAAERVKVTGEIRASWAQVEQMTELLEANIERDLIGKSLSRMDGSGVDAVDAMMVEAAIRAGVRQVITDDGDFCCVPGMMIFTGNRAVIEAARAANRLVKR